MGPTSFEAVIHNPLFSESSLFEMPADVKFWGGGFFLFFLRVVGMAQ